MSINVNVSVHSATKIEIQHRSSSGPNRSTNWIDFFVLHNDGERTEDLFSVFYRGNHEYFSRLCQAINQVNEEFFPSSTKEPIE